MKAIESTIPIMNHPADKHITDAGNFTNQFVFPAGFASPSLAQNPLSQMSREQLAAFLNAESSNGRSAHFSAPAAEPTPPTPEKGLAIGVLRHVTRSFNR